MIKHRIRLEFPCTSEGLRELASVMEQYPEHKPAYGSIATMSNPLVILEIEKPVESSHEVLNAMCET